MSNKENRPTRRSRLLGDRPGSYAIARGVRMSATKVRRVVDLVRGMPVTDALTVLKFAPQAASEPVYKVVASASANAQSTEDLRAEELFISQAFVDEGMTAIWTARDGTSRTGTIYRVEPCFNPRDMYTLFVAVASQPPSHQEMKP